MISRSITTFSRADQPHPVAFGAGRQAKASAIGKARFDPVSPLIGVKKLAVGAGHFGYAGIGRTTREDIVILRKIIKQMPPQD